MPHSTGKRGVSYDPSQRRQRRDIPSIVRRVTLGVVVVWLALVASLSGWVAQRLTAEELDNLAAGAEYEAQITGRVVDRLFTEMASVANMVARQSEVIQLAARYRHDPPGFAALTREERASKFTRDPLVRSVGDFMDRLAGDLHYARIYMNNLSDDTVTASNWAESFSIVGQIYTGRAYLLDALRTGSGEMFGIARLNKTPSYFVASRIDDADGKPLGSVTVKFDAPDIALYLTGRHIALIVNRQGRVTTASSEPFMLRNVAALLPPDIRRPLDGDEEPGEPMDIRAVAAAAQADQWLIGGHPYLVHRQPLNDAQYQLLTLAKLDHLQPMRQQYYWTGASVAALGLILILLSSRVAGQMLLRRQEERYAANYDALTGLKNRRAILAALHRHFALAKRTGQGVLVAFIDLDEFKAINDTYGHEVGDKFLIEGSRRLQGGLRATDELGRWGGDEFVVIGLTASVNPDEMAKTAAAMRRRLVPLLIGSYEFDDCRFDYAGASFGITSVDPAATSLQAALKAYPLHEAHIPSDYLKPDAALPISFWSQSAMMRPDSKVEKVYLYPKPVDFRKSIDGLTALVELDIKVAVFDPVLFVFLNKARNRIKVLYWERNGFCLWLKRLEAERFKTSPDATDEAIVLTVQELNWLLDGFDLWRNRPHQVLTPRFVA